MHLPIKKCYYKAISLYISIPIAGWQETFRSPASRLAGVFGASDSRLAGDQKVSCQPAGRRPRLNDITEDIDSELRLFADDCVCYREIKDTEDTVKLQEDINHLGCWARSWGMKFQPVKCNIMQITRKRIKKINASYSLEGTVLENVEKIKYLGVTITNDLKWNTHVSNICTKANRTLGLLRRNLAACPLDVKECLQRTGMSNPGVW